MSPDLPTWDEPARPVITPYTPTPVERAHGDHLRQIHDMYRGALGQVAGALSAADPDAADIRAAVHATGLQAAYQRAGSFCGQLCRAVDTHHRIEDAHLYPALRAADPDRLEAVLDRLYDEHEVVHAVLERLDAEVVRFAADPARLGELSAVFDHLRGLLESHFAYEEQQIGDALGVHGVMV